MADEIRVLSQLSITKGTQQTVSRPAQFNDDQSGKGGPSPGAITATTAGVDVTFDLTLAGWTIIRNYDATNFVEVGVWDGAAFHELGEIPPETHQIVKLSRNLTTLRLKADTASCECSVEAYEA